MGKKLVVFTISTIFLLICISCQKVPEITRDSVLEGKFNTIKDNISIILSKEKTTSSKDELIKIFNEYILADKELNGIKEKNEFFFMLGDKDNKKAVLLIHGLGASPGEMKELGEFLNSKGLTVLGVRVSGHGNTLDALEASKWLEWYDSVKFSYDVLSYLSDEIYVVGMSAGASLGFLLVEKEAEKEIDNIIDNIRGIVSIDAPVFMQDPKFEYISVLKYFKRYSERNLTEEEKPIYNEALPTRTIEQLKFLIEEEKRILPKITTPVLIIQAANDTRVNPKSAEYVYNHVGTEEKNKGIKWVEEDKHVVLAGKYKNDVFNDILIFISS